MYCVGLTGTIASGKSTVADLFATFNIDIISADAIARSLTTIDKPALLEIAHYFGSTVLTETGELNRPVLRSRIFNNPTERQWLEQCLHPRIRKCILESISISQSPYCVIEIPLLTSRTAYPYLNRILLVHTDRNQQIARLMERDRCSEIEALSILNTQADACVYHAIANDVIINDETRSALKKQVYNLHQYYLKACKKK